MAVICLSSKGASSLSCPLSSSTTAPPMAALSASSTKSVSVACPSSSLAIKLGLPSSSSNSSTLPGKLGLFPSTSNAYRSSMLSAPLPDYGSSFGAVTLLPGLLQKGGEAVRQRNGSARAYLESKNPVMKFLSRVQGALPVVGLISRLLSPEGGVGTDRIRFEEFCTRVGRNCTLQDSSAFYQITANYGKPAKAPFVLIWCWAAALGAGLLRSEDLLMGASRLRVSYDIQYEVENFDLLMDEAIKKREKSGSKVPDVPMEARAEKALEAMCLCCTGRKEIAEEDAPLFSTILKVVFPTADKEQIEFIVASRLFDPFTSSETNSESQDLDDGEAAAVDEQQEGLVEEQQSSLEEQEVGLDEQLRSIVQNYS